MSFNNSIHLSASNESVNPENATNGYPFNYDAGDLSLRVNEFFQDSGNEMDSESSVIAGGNFTYEENSPLIADKSKEIDDFLSRLRTKDVIPVEVLDKAENVWNSLKANYADKLFLPLVSYNRDVIHFAIRQPALYIEFEVFASSVEMFCQNLITGEDELKEVITVNDDNLWHSLDQWLEA